MWSICIKFKPITGWRPLVRQFETEDACKGFINDAFDKWKVQHVSVFKDNLFMTCYWMSPRTCAAIRASVENMRRSKQRLYGNYNFR